MAPITAETARVTRVADQVVADIELRGLVSGDRYLTADQVSRMLGVRKTTANQALSYLAKQQRLVRSQRRGTFVGPRFSGEPCPGDSYKIKLIQFLVPALSPERSQRDLPSCEDLIAGVHDVLPGISVQFNYLPNRDITSYLEGSIAHGKHDGESTGFVAMSCPREVYRFFRDRELPVVVLGSPYPDTQAIASIDVDKQQVGSMLARYVLDRGHRRIALLAYQTWHPGDNLMLETLGQSLSQGGLSVDGLIIRAIPDEKASYEAEVRQLLSSENRPTTLICLGLTNARIAAATATHFGLRVPDDVLVIYEAKGPLCSVDSGFPRVQRCDSFRNIAARIATMLLNQSEKKPLAEHHVQLPVELCDAGA